MWLNPLLSLETHFLNLTKLFLAEKLEISTSVCKIAIKQKKFPGSVASQRPSVKKPTVKSFYDTSEGHFVR